ncbi:MAG: class I SAM-dependent methyltransferase [Myxococcota bacterium]|nr:class I SAM-dependent methyltransferase [Myxococcota bacterium]
MGSKRLVALLLSCLFGVAGCAEDAPDPPEWLVLRDPQAPAPVTPVDPRPYGHSQPYRFDSDWFSKRVPVWGALLQPYMGRPDVRYLEVGLWQGRSLLWVLENVLTHPESRATGIDISLHPDLLHNLAISGAQDRVTAIEAASQQALRELPVSSYDIIYIDGSHTADDVLADMVLAWPLLKPGGVMILDDYRYAGKIETGGTELPPELLPEIAVDAFISAYRNYVEVLHEGYQVALRKRTGVCSRSKWQCSTLGEYSYDWKLKTLYKGDESFDLSDGQRKIVEALINSKQGDGQTLRMHPALYEWSRALDERLGLGIEPPGGG